MKATAFQLRDEDAKRWTQQRLARLFGVDQKTVSRWFEGDDISNRHVPNPNIPDARLSVPKAVRAERKAGELLAEMPKKANQHDASNTTLQALEIDRMQSSRWQKLASIPEAEFVEHVRKISA